MSAEAPSYYPTDLSENQWHLLARLLPPAKSGAGKRGRPVVDRRRVCNGIGYVVKTGCQWRMLPREFGRWTTVYGYFRAWQRRGLWAWVLGVLTMVERQRQGRHAEPSAGCVDSQSVKSATQGYAVGFDGGKAIKGRKRHLLTDTLGLIQAVVVTAANVHDQVGLRRLLGRWFIPGVRRLRKLWADQGYAGEPLRQWVRTLKRTHKIDLEISQRQGRGFQVEPRRWVVERTFAWLGHCRRHAKDYEVLPDHSEAMIQIAMILLLLRRLAP